MKISLALFIFGSLLILDTAAQNCPDACICLPDLIQCENGHLSEFPIIDSNSSVTINLVNCSIAFKEINHRHFEVYANTALEEFSLLTNHKVDTIASYSFLPIKNKLINLEISTERVDDYAFDQLSVKNRLSLHGLKTLSSSAFSGLRNVQILELVNGNLSEFPIEDLIALSKNSILTSLSISGNNFNFLDESYDRLFSNLQKIDLSDNPWHCDCGLSWLIKRYKSKKSPLTSKKPICSSPFQLKGKSFDDLLTDPFESRNSNNSSILICSRLKIDQIDINLENISPEEEIAKIACKISSVKPVNINWLHNNKKILPDGNFEIEDKYKNEELVWEQTIMGPIRLSQKTNHMSTIKVRKIGDRDIFSCSVKDDQTKESLLTSIAIQWSPKHKQTTPIVIPQTMSIPSESKELTFLETGIFHKQFSLIELLGGIIGTFLCTTLLFVIGYRISQNYSTSICCYYQNNSLPRKYNRNDLTTTGGLIANGNHFDDYLKQLTNFQTYLSQQNNTNNTSPIGTDSSNMSNISPKDYNSTLQQKANQQLLQNNFATLLKNSSGQDNGNFMFLPNGLIFPNTQNQIQNKNYEIYTDSSQNLYDIPNKLTPEQTALLYSNQVNPLPITAPPPLFMGPSNNQVDSNISSPKFQHNTNLGNQNNRFQPI